MGRRNKNVDWGGRYPPGAKNDPRAPYNQPDRTHEHRWQHKEEPIQPVIEDGAAIFYEECLYAEGKYGEGWECEEERKYRFEYSSLKTPCGNTWELPVIGNWDGLHPGVEEIAIFIESAFHVMGPGGEVTWDVDPDPKDGVVIIEYLGFELRYEP